MVILYPTETLYALGVRALDASDLSALFSLKERDVRKSFSWLVRDMEDVEKYAQVPHDAAEIAKQFLPGSLTLVLKARMHVPDEFLAPDRTIAFRISSDPIAQELVAEYMETYKTPLTCTSANISGCPTLSNVGEILQQFGSHARAITKVIDDGPRKGLASTIVRVINDEVDILREGELTESRIRSVIAR